MGRHLASTRLRLVFRPYRLQQHDEGGQAQLQTERAVAIIRIKPVVARPQVQGGGQVERLMPYTIDLKIDAILSFQLDFLVVQFSRKIHGAISADDQLGRKFGSLLQVSGGGHSASPKSLATAQEASPADGYIIKSGSRKVNSGEHRLLRWI